MGKYTDRGNNALTFTETEVTISLQRKREYRQRYETKHPERAHRPYRPSPTRSTVNPFLAWDGEGITLPNGEHLYTMLCNSRRDYIADKHGLSTQRILAYVCKYVKQYPKQIHIAFGASYDANMTLGALPFECVDELAHQGVTHWLRYRIEYRPRKLFMVTPYHGSTPASHTKANRSGPSFVLWDVFSFFQSRFVKAMKAWNIITAYDQIVAMKAKRGSFTNDESHTVLEYCFAECRNLATLCETLRTRCKAVGLTPHRWDGAGALATRMFQLHHVKKYMGAPVPPAQYAYFGGRIEQIKWGRHQEPCYSHDLHSAYSWAALHLPCLAHGKWVQTGTTASTTFALYHLRASFPDNQSFYPLPYRLPNGNVTFPQIVQGWYWQPEALIAIARGKCKIDATLTWHPDCNHEPFLFLQTMYNYRELLAIQGDAAEKVLKLAMNALYGKLAQKNGRKDRKGNYLKPSYHQLEWAGYITSLVRARIYNAAVTNPDSIIAFETDGIYTTEQLPITPVNTGLGSWEIKQHTAITYVQSGFYFRTDNGTLYHRHRGFDPETISHEMVLDGWRNSLHTISGQTTRFRGMKVATVSRSSFPQWRRWITRPRDLALAPSGKRMAFTKLFEGTNLAAVKTCLEMTLVTGLETFTDYPLAAERLQSTLPTFSPHGESAIHPLPWVTGRLQSSPDDAAEIILAWEDMEDYT
ncbi:MAG: DNA polymerase [Candidatus Saccharimonadales bacterium]